MIALNVVFDLISRISRGKMKTYFDFCARSVVRQRLRGLSQSLDLSCQFAGRCGTQNQTFAFLPAVLVIAFVRRWSKKERQCGSFEGRQ